jgi:hypothetical protein
MLLTFIGLLIFSMCSYQTLNNIFSVVVVSPRSLLRIEQASLNYVFYK